MSIDRRGHVTDQRVKLELRPLPERAGMPVVHGIIVHRTDAGSTNRQDAPDYPKPRRNDQACSGPSSRQPGQSRNGIGRQVIAWSCAEGREKPRNGHSGAERFARPADRWPDARDEHRADRDIPSSDRFAEDTFGGIDRRMAENRLTATMAMAVIGSASAMPTLAASKVMVVTITENGARSDDVSGDETAASCATFTLSKRDVEQFLKRSERVTSRAYDHDLEMSRCHAAGRVSYPNGTRGRWRIDMARRGMLILNSGRRRYFYCRTCTSPRFDVPYDPAIDG